MTSQHIPVMVDEILKYLLIRPDGLYVDCTVDGGGHAELILETSAPTGRLIGLDMDPLMLQRAKSRLERFGDRLTLVHANYIDLPRVMDEVGWRRADGILLDCGLSSNQLDSPERGFSFQADGPIDMRFDQSAGEPILNWLRRSDVGELADVLLKYGEEPHASAVARAIKAGIDGNRLETTRQLAETVARAVPRRLHPRRKHPATRTFQSLRIRANSELDNLGRLLPRALERLVFGGRLAVLTYHGLEDGLVRRTFRHWARRCVCPPGLPVCVCGKKQEAVVVTKKALRPSREEIEANPRARSAKLRVAERRVEA